MKKLGLATLVLFLVSTASAASVGTNPGFQDFGEIRKGETRVANVYVTTTGYDSPFAVRPVAGESLSSTYLDSQDSPFSPAEYSGEDITEWIRFDQNAFRVTPANTTEYIIGDGVTVNYAGRIKFYIEVPRDAEPGYHAGMINVNPQLTNSGTGFGASTRGQSMYTFVFRVPGNVEKSIDVVDARGIRTGEDRARIDIRVANRGTVTTSIRGSNIDVYNRQTMSKVDDLPIGYHKLAPGQSKIISRNLRSNSIEEGSYQVNGSIEYIGGSSFVSQQTFSLADTIQDNPPEASSFGPSDTEGDSGSPMWLLGLFVVMVSVIMYAMEFELFSIILVGGGLGIVGFIVFTGIPNWTLLILLTSTLGILMYG
ncbi:hypothetical protein [Candidatus Nanohalovita haloferacivicina]|uniref:hypothetical protein n=1 Tax=Candidatus Nanohalovita haloferacivicina TaxID=2978046 RepID=UPI00325FB239|nr:hypothetical protein HBNXNv_0195 [Candidatus Nanohalobia archaeon BNXNv]